MYMLLFRNIWEEHQPRLQLKSWLMFFSYIRKHTCIIWLTLHYCICHIRRAGSENFRSLPALVRRDELLKYLCFQDVPTPVETGCILAYICGVHASRQRTIEKQNSHDVMEEQSVCCVQVRTCSFITFVGTSECDFITFVVNVSKSAWVLYGMSNGKCCASEGEEETWSVSSMSVLSLLTSRAILRAY